MAIVTSQTLSSESSNNHRDASFSSYLHDDERILALSESNENIISVLCASHEQIYNHKQKIEDTEIGVFSAEKYFKGGMDKDGNSKLTGNGFKRYQHEKDVSVNVEPAKLKTGSLSVRSTSSSNSQTTLLPGNHQRGKMNKASSSFFSTLGCICSCNDKNSVKVDQIQNKAIMKQPKENGELLQIKKTSSETWADQEDTRFRKFDEIGVGLSIQECFTFPILDAGKGSLAAELQLPEGEDKIKSAEVFGSPIVDHGKKNLSFERKTTMLNWNLLNPKKQGFGITANPNVSNSDSESDASSDLFEIESFSTKTNSFLGRQTSDGASSCVSPTTCYTPSEASIEWSVVTASAAEFSIMSETEEIRTTANTRNQNRTTAGKDQHRRRPNILLGCKSHKAVRVAGDAYKISDEVIPVPDGRHRLDSCKPLAKFQAETKLTGLGLRHGHNAFHTRSVSPANGSQFFYVNPSMVNWRNFGPSWI